MDLVHYTSPLLWVVELDNVLQGGAELVPREEGEERREGGGGGRTEEGRGRGKSWYVSWKTETLAVPLVVPLLPLTHYPSHSPPLPLTHHPSHSPTTPPAHPPPLPLTHHPSHSPTTPPTHPTTPPTHPTTPPTHPTTDGVCMMASTMFPRMISLTLSGML